MGKAKSICTQAELATVLQLSRGRISQLARKGLPVRPDGKIDQDAALKWYRSHFPKARFKSGPKPRQQAANHKDEPDSSAAYMIARTRKEVALAELRELEAAQKRGDLLLTSEVREVWERHIDVVKNRLLLLSSKVPAECRAQVEHEVRAALRELSEYVDAA